MPLVKGRSPVARAKPARLDAPGAEERRAAALALARDAAGAAPLLAALSRETVREVQAAMVTALVAIRTEEAATGLVALLGAEDAGLRSDAVEGLRRMGAVAAGPVGALLDNADPDLRLFAVNVLERLEGDASRAMLRAVLADEAEVNVGLAAVEALGQIGRAEDADALRDFAARFPAEPMVRFAVELAAGQLGPGPG